jgi:hypothetical protein
MTPAKTEGPYFVDERLDRSDIRGAQDGVPLALTMYVFDAGSDCAPVAGARVDVWHANASGRYSDVSANATAGQTWLRGYQRTDAEGKVRFTTIWPGWYGGRAVHIHFKVRTGSLEFTSQLFFTDEMNATVFGQAPYRSRGNPDTTDRSDGIYGSDGGSLLLHPVADGSGGYAADFSVGIGGGSTGSTPPAADTTLSATLVSARSLRSSAGRRVRVVVRPRETVALTARLSRGGRTLARRRVGLRPGRRVVEVPIGRDVTPGGASLTVRLVDAAGNPRTWRRFLHVPRSA